MVDTSKGYIKTHVSYAACCGRCNSFFDDYDSKSRDAFVKLIRRDGWKLTAARGWVCGKCLKRLKAVQP